MFPLMKALGSRALYGTIFLMNHLPRGSSRNENHNLFSAVKQSNDRAVRALIDAGADVNVTDKDGKTALFYAVQQRNEKVVRALIDAGADVNVSDKHDGTTILMNAIKTNHISESAIFDLINAVADVNATDVKLQTALFHAVQQSDNESVVRALIDAGANVNMTDKDGKTALFYAAQQSDNESVVRALIDAGADVNITDNEGKTALLHAVQRSNNMHTYRPMHSNNERMVCALIDAGADITISDEYGKTALFYAVQQNDENVVRALIDSVGLKDIYGRTAHFYVDLKNPSSLGCLLEAGENRYLDLRDNCNVDIVSFLIEKWVLSKEISLADFKDGVLVVLAKHGTKRESFTKAIVNVMFLKSIQALKRKYTDAFFPEAASNNVEKLQNLGGLYKEYIGFWRGLRRKEKKKMKSILKSLKNGFPNISEVLELLAELDANPDSADSEGNTVLHHTTRLPLSGVSQETVMDLCNQLERFGVQFNKRNHRGQTALLFCLSADMNQLNDEDLSSAVNTLVQVCKFLVKQGSSMDETPKSGESVFYLIIKLFERCFKVKDEAIRNDVLREASKLLQLFPPWKAAKRKTINIQDLHLINSPLHLWASLALPSPLDYVRDVSREDLTFKALLDNILQYLLKCGAKVNARNENDETPLHLCKTWTALQLLIEAGANSSVVDSSGRPPLLVAAREKSFHEKLDHFYPDVTEDPKVFWKTAVQMGLDPWKADRNDESVLSILVESENFVLSKGLVDVACEEGYTKSENVAVPLLNAICKDRSSRTRWKTVLVQDILKSREIESCPSTASTPLRHCCRNIIEADVLDKTAKPSIQNNLDVAQTGIVTHFLEGVFSWFFGRGMPAVQASANETPTPEGKRGRKFQTSSAAYNSVHCEIANLLLSYGANIETPDFSGESCLDIAESHPALKDFLTKPLDQDEFPIVIPWTSTSTKYEDRMAKVARRQECKVVDQIWYHKDHMGSGSYGLIFAGINEKDGREVAIKRIEKLRMQRPQDGREIENLTALAHCEQIVRYISFFEDEDFSYVFLELMEGNLEEYLNGSTTDATQATPLCKDVVMGLKFLHEQKILHRDLKPQNILYKVHPKPCLKIADFGLSCIIESVSTTCRVDDTQAGTQCWIAPEVLNSKANKVDKNCFKLASDMFSCGLLLHYILSGQKHPFKPTDCANKNEQQVINETEVNVMKGKMEGWDKSLSPEATHLVKRMLENNEKDRPSAEEALEHPLFWSNEKKVDFLEAVGNQKEFECPRSKRTLPRTQVETAIENGFNTLVTNGKYKRATGKGRKKYDTSSPVDLVRFIRNLYEQYGEKTFSTPVPVEHMPFDDFVFLKHFPDLVMEVYKAVTTHGWDQTRDDIKYAMSKK